MMPMCPALFGYPVPTIILPCGVQVYFPTSQQVTPGICRWTKGGTELQGCTHSLLYSARLLFPFQGYHFCVDVSFERDFRVDFGV
jgi:hypothetical protein